MAKSEKESGGKEMTSRVERVPRVMSPFEEMDRMMETFFPEGWFRPFRWGGPRMLGGMEERVPRVDVVEHDDDIVVRAEVPGVEKDELDVSVTDNSVTIRGSSRSEKEEKKGDYYRCEISRGAFSRTVSLPSDIDSEKADAKFKNGILELTLPKMERSKRRSIEVH